MKEDTNKKGRKCSQIINKVEKTTKPKGESMPPNKTKSRKYSQHMSFE